ncbi:MAG: copper ion binding protein, partial [Deltaproteobacteria bacterium]|nr:copper ion binding protein [Deltaproteobacteria bacterium]
MSEKRVTFPVTGMTCANCASNIERAIKKLPGVREAHVNFATEEAAISFDPEEIQIHDLAAGIQNAGYGVAKATIEFPVTGMTCANCAMTIEKTLHKKVPGILRASVNFAAERAFVEYIPSLTDPDGMMDAIENAGYGAIRPDDTGDDDAELAARKAEIR